MWTLQISHWNKCSTHLRISWQNKMRSLDWKQLFGRKVMDISAINWWWMNHQSSTHEGLYVWNSILSWKDPSNPESNEAWKKRIRWIISYQSYKNFIGIKGETTELECNIFPGFDTLQLCGKVKALLSRLEKHQKISHVEFSWCRCSTTFLVEWKTKKNVWHTLELYLYKRWRKTFYDLENVFGCMYGSRFGECFWLHVREFTVCALAQTTLKTLDARSWMTTWQRLMICFQLLSRNGLNAQRVRPTN